MTEADNAEGPETSLIEYMQYCAKRNIVLSESLDDATGLKPRVCPGEIGIAGCEWHWVRRCQVREAAKHNGRPSEVGKGISKLMEYYSEQVSRA